jgi:hypothetical protein
LIRRVALLAVVQNPDRARGGGEDEMVPSLYSERHVQYLWERQQFSGAQLLTEDARSLLVEFPGVPSGEGGPDFRGARLVIGGERRCGDVEIHLDPAGWSAHGHGGDGAYAGVILHVVLRRRPFGEGPRGVPVLVLEPYLHLSAVAPAAGPAGDLDALGDEWFAERRARLLRSLERAPADEVLHREILVALGYKHNKAAMAELARRCPLRAVAGDAGAIEGRLRAAASELPRGMWRLRNIRPANHPWRRISGMARFLAAARGEGLARGLEARAGSLESMAAWLDPDGTGQIGPGRAREVALNVFVPFLGPEAWRRVADEAPPEGPGSIRRLLGDRVNTVRRYFGALRLLRRG